MAHPSAYMVALSGAVLVTLLGCFIVADARIQAKTHGHHGRHGGYGHGHGHKHNPHHYNPCGNIYAGNAFCKHKHAGHYGHHNKKCYIQCDSWGRGFVRPCAKGTYWHGGKGPTKFNKCVGRNHHNQGYGGYGGGYGAGYGGGYGGGGYGRGGYGGGRYGFGGFGGGFGGRY